MDGRGGSGGITSGVGLSGGESCCGFWEFDGGGPSPDLIDGGGGDDAAAIGDSDGGAGLAGARANGLRAAASRRERVPDGADVAKGALGAPLLPPPMAPMAKATVGRTSKDMARDANASHILR